MESTLGHQPVPAAARTDVDLVTTAADGNDIQEIEPAAALTKEELKAAAREYTVIDKRCWVWKHVGLLKTPAFNASQKLYSHVCLRCLEKNRSQLSNCLIAVFHNQSSNVISHIEKNHKALVEEEHGIIAAAASTASLSAARRLALLTNPKQASTGSSIIGTFLNKGNGVVLDRVHAVLTHLMVNHRLPMTIPLDDDTTNLIVEAATHLRAGLYQPMTRGMVDWTLLLM